jgi:RNA polymerase sigma factor (sigma-70 family)
MDDTGERELADRLAADLQDGFTELVRIYAVVVRTFLLRLSGSPSEADDLGQETFLRAYGALRGYSPDRRRALRPRPWLMTIAANIWRNHVRTAVRHPVAALPAEDSCLAWPDQGPGPEERAANALDRDVLTAALVHLPERYRVAIVLRHVLGMSYAEMAEVQGCPVGTAKAHVSRGLVSLRELLRPDAARLKEATM